MLKILFVALSLLWLMLCSAYAKSPAQITIILDDVGARASDANAFDLPKSVTFSILPHTKYSTVFSFFAAEQNREVMLHMPMESLNGEALGEGPLLASMYPQQLQKALYAALATVPHAVGVNNHMGSKLTQMTLPMQTVMDVLAGSNMFFIDSRTTRFTKAGSIAEDAGVYTATRHIFLDHEQNRDFLERQFAKLIKQAQRDGKAIGIGHPYPVTLEFLQSALMKLPKDIEIVTVSQYLQETDKFRINPHWVKSNAEQALSHSDKNTAPD